jgi:plasmid stabilization system protein ParE
VHNAHYITQNDEILTAKFSDGIKFVPWGPKPAASAPEAWRSKLERVADALELGTQRDGKSLEVCLTNCC